MWKDSRSAGVGVPTGVRELEAVVDDGVVIYQPSALDPVPAVEAGKVLDTYTVSVYTLFITWEPPRTHRADVANLLGRVVVREVQPVAHRRALRQSTDIRAG